MSTATATATETATATATEIATNGDFAPKVEEILNEYFPSASEEAREVLRKFLEYFLPECEKVSEIPVRTLPKPPLDCFLEELKKCKGRYLPAVLSMKKKLKEEYSDPHFKFFNKHCGAIDTILKKELPAANTTSTVASTSASVVSVPAPAPVAPVPAPAPVAPVPASASVASVPVASASVPIASASASVVSVPAASVPAITLDKEKYKQFLEHFYKRNGKGKGKLNNKTEEELIKFLKSFLALSFNFTNEGKPVTPAELFVIVCENFENPIVKAFDTLKELEKKAYDLAKEIKTLEKLPEEAKNAEIIAVLNKKKEDLAITNKDHRSSKGFAHGLENKKLRNVLVELKHLVIKSINESISSVITAHSESIEEHSKQRATSKSHVVDTTAVDTAATAAAADDMNEEEDVDKDGDEEEEQEE